LSAVNKILPSALAAARVVIPPVPAIFVLLATSHNSATVTAGELASTPVLLTLNLISFQAIVPVDPELIENFDKVFTPATNVDVGKLTKLIVGIAL